MMRKRLGIQVLIALLLLPSVAMSLDVWGNVRRVRMQSDSIMFKYGLPIADVWERGDSSETIVAFEHCTLGVCTCYATYKTKYNDYPVVVDSVDTIISTPCSTYMVTNYRTRGYALGGPNSRFSDIWALNAHIAQLEVGSMIIDTVIYTVVDTANVARNALKLGGLFPESYLRSNVRDTFYVLVGSKAVIDTLIVDYLVGTISHADTANYAWWADTSYMAITWDGHSWGTKYPYCHYADSANYARVGLVVICDSARHAIWADTADYAYLALTAIMAQNSAQWNGHNWGYLYPLADTANYAWNVMGSADTAKVVSEQTGWPGHCIPHYADTIHGCSKVVVNTNESQFLGSVKIDSHVTISCTTTGYPSVGVSINYENTHVDYDCFGLNVKATQGGWISTSNGNRTAIVGKAFGDTVSGYAGRDFLTGIYGTAETYENSEDILLGGHFETASCGKGKHYGIMAKGYNNHADGDTSRGGFFYARHQGIGPKIGIHATIDKAQGSGTALAGLFEGNVLITDTCRATVFIGEHLELQKPRVMIDPQNGIYYEDPTDSNHTDYLAEEAEKVGDDWYFMVKHYDEGVDRFWTQSLMREFTFRDCDSVGIDSLWIEYKTEDLVDAKLDFYVYQNGTAVALKSATDLQSVNWTTKVFTGFGSLSPGDIIIIQSKLHSKNGKYACVGRVFADITERY